MAHSELAQQRQQLSACPQAMGPGAVPCRRHIPSPDRGNKRTMLLDRKRRLRA
jgi:hypothetical protein